MITIKIIPSATMLITPITPKAITHLLSLQQVLLTVPSEPSVYVASAPPASLAGPVSLAPQVAPSPSWKLKMPRDKVPWNRRLLDTNTREDWRNTKSQDVMFVIIIISAVNAPLVTTNQFRIAEEAGPIISRDVAMINAFWCWGFPFSLSPPPPTPSLLFTTSRLLIFLPPPSLPPLLTPFKSLHFL